MENCYLFGIFCMDYEHGSTHIDGTKSYRRKDGGVYSKCRTIEELYELFKQQPK